MFAETDGRFVTDQSVAGLSKIYFNFFCPFVSSLHYEFQENPGFDFRFVGKLSLQFSAEKGTMRFTGNLSIREVCKLCRTPENTHVLGIKDLTVALNKQQ